MPDTPHDQARPSGPHESAPTELSLPQSAAELAVGLLLLVLALVIFVEAGAIVDHSPDPISSDAFPRAVSFLLGLFCLVMIARAVRAQFARRSVKRFAPALGDEPYVSITRPLAVAGLVVTLLAVPAVLETLGYYATTLIAFMIFLVAGGVRRPLLILPLTAGFLAFIYAVFDTFLNIPLPEGLLR